MNWFSKFFNIKEQVEVDVEDNIYTNSSNENEWFELEKQKPPHEVVLAACDTYDCGWVMDTVWWNEEEQCWMLTGTVDLTHAHLYYTHWRKLPAYPDRSK